MVQQAARGMALRAAFFWLAVGLGVSGAIALFAPVYAPWAILAAGVCLAAALIARPRGPVADDRIAASKSDTALGLPALAREVFERLPDPLMLVDVPGRVVFANKAMTAVVGTDTH